jgi:hypothetical protein
MVKATRRITCAAIRKIIQQGTENVIKKGGTSRKEEIGQISTFPK